MRFLLKWSLCSLFPYFGLAVCDQTWKMRKNWHYWYFVYYWTHLSVRYENIKRVTISKICVSAEAKLSHLRLCMEESDVSSNFNSNPHYLLECESNEIKQQTHFCVFIYFYARNIRCRRGFKRRQCSYWQPTSITWILLALQIPDNLTATTTKPKTNIIKEA